MFLGISLKAQFHRISNLKFSQHFLNNETGSIASSPIEEGWWSAQWQLTPVSGEQPNDFCIVNRWTNCALDVENDILVCNPFNSNTKSQQWQRVAEDDKGYCSLVNVGNAKYLCEQNNTLILENACKDEKSARWKLADMNIDVLPPSSPVDNAGIGSPTTVIGDSPEPVPNPETNPTSYNGVLSQAQIDDFVNSHNLVRAEVGTGKVIWSPQVAEFAQKWANHLANEGGCNLEHSQSSDYGENIYQGSEITLSKPSLSVEAWASEKAEYRGGVIKLSLKAGHYTQVIWAKTTEIGCGLAVCPDKTSVFGNIITVCNYNPAGNMIGQNPLKK